MSRIESPEKDSQNSTHAVGHLGLVENLTREADKDLQEYHKLVQLFRQDLASMKAKIQNINEEINETTTPLLQSLFRGLELSMISQKEENTNFQEQITDLKKEKSVLGQMIVASHKRVELLNEQFSLTHHISHFKILSECCYGFILYLLNEQICLELIEIKESIQTNMSNLRCSESHVGLPYNYRPQIEKELMRSLPNSLFTPVQAAKVIRMAASMLKINLLECSLLAWLLRNSKHNLGNMESSTLSISFLEEDHSKQLLLLILLNAYYVKTFLANGRDNFVDIDAEIETMIPSFAKIYRGWRPDSTLKDASLDQLNLTFNGWVRPQRRTKPDYGQLVNKILQLSKTYNTGENDEGVPKKKRKINVEDKQEKEEKEEKEERPKMNKLSFDRDGAKIDEFAYWQQVEPFDREPEHQIEEFNMLRRSSRIRSGFFPTEMNESRLFNLNDSILPQSRDVFRRTCSKLQIKKCASFSQLS